MSRSRILVNTSGQGFTVYSDPMVIPRSTLPVGRLAALAAVAVAAAAIVITLTPRQWQSTARLTAVDDDFDADRTVTVLGSGAVLRSLVEDPALLSTMGVTPGPHAATSMSMILNDQVTTINADDEVWVLARDRDGDRAYALVAAILEAGKSAEVEVHRRLLGEREQNLEQEVTARSARVEDVVNARPADGDDVAAAVWQAQLRESASRLADAQEDLVDTRRKATNLEVSWFVADAPEPFQHVVGRRLGPAIAAAVTAPLLLVCLAVLIAGRRPGS